MQPDRKDKYLVFYGKYRAGKNKQDLTEIPFDQVDIFENFEFYDYSFFDTCIGNLKEYFLTNFCQKYPCCKCQIAVYNKNPNNNKYHLIQSEAIKLKGNTELYIINIKPKCNCEYKDFKDYFTIPKFDMITKLKILEEEIRRLETSNNELTKENEKLRKAGELKYHINPEFEKFYDIVIDIKSIKKVNTDGWKVKFTENGLNKYKEYKDKDLITIGVIGNNNKGKSFLLSKISKIELLTGTSIQTEGLSVKYPELKGYKGRQIILLDSAGLETPVLKSNNDNNNNNNKKINEKKEPIQKIVEEKNKENNNEKNENNINNENEQEEKSEENPEEKENEQKEISEENPEEKEKEEEKEEEQNLDNKDKPIDKEFEQNKEFKENARDKIMTELFLENFIINVSDILLLVVGKLTYSEQLLINKIKVEAKKQNKQKIFIIHNLQEFRTRAQVENYIQESLLKCSTFNLVKRTNISTEEDKDKKNKKIKNKENIKINENINNKKLKEEIQIELNKRNNLKINENKNDKNEIKNNININNNNHEEEEKNNEEEKDKEDIKINDVHFNEILKYEDKKLEIYHLIIANEDSDAGKFYNPYAYSFIEKAYNLVSEPKKFDIFEEVKSNFKNLSDTILNDNIVKVPFTDNKNIIKDKIIKLKYEKDLNLKKCYIDELGFSLFKTGNFEPKYNYFKKDENTLEIRLEVPGNVKCNVEHKVIEDKTMIIDKGEKKKDKEPAKPNYNLFNIREFSEFELNIPLKTEDLQITKLKDNYPIFKNGVCFIQYELFSKTKNQSAVVEEEI